MELHRLRQLAGLGLPNEKNTTLRPAGKDPMTVKHTGQGGLPDEKNLTLAGTGKAAKNPLREEDLMEAPEMVEKVLAKVKAIHQGAMDAKKDGKMDVHAEKMAGLKAVHAECCKHV